MITADVMREMADKLAAITKLNRYAFPSDSITPPAVVVGFPEITFDRTYGRGMDTFLLPVWVVVGRLGDQSAAENLAAYSDGSGEASVKEQIQAGTYTSFDTVRVTSALPDNPTFGGVEYLAYMFDLDIAGDGAS